MRDVISAALERELQIIQMLYEESECKSVKELGEKIEASEVTIRKDIKRISENFSFLQIEVNSRGQIKLNYPDYVGMEYVYRRAMNLSLELKIFEYLLNRKNYSISKFTEVFFISESMFRRIIHKWNQAFANRGLAVSISTYPTVTIQGEEIVVRQLYHRYMAEKYEGNFRSELSGELSSIWELITRIWDIFGTKISYATHLKLSYWAFICLQRIKQGYHIKKEHTEAGKKMAQKLYDTISKDIVFMEQFVFDYHIGLSVEVLLDIIEIYDYDLLLKERLSREISNYENKEINLSIKSVKDFLSSLYESVQYHNAPLEKTSIALYNSLVFQNRIPFFFYDFYREFKKYIKQENPVFFHLFEGNLQNSTLPDYLKENDELKYELLYYVVIHSKSLLDIFDDTTKQKKVLILTTYYYKYMYWIRDEIEKRFGGSVSIALFQSNEFRVEIDYLNQFDIILSNYENLPIELENRVIYLEAGASATFWEKLTKKVK